VNQPALLAWYEKLARPLFARHAADRLAALDNDYERLKRLLASSDKVTACFLGASGIGKSTLLNALAAGADQVLPAGGIGPLTAQATEVHYSGVPSFKAAYHSRSQLWKIGFALESKWTRDQKTLIRAEGRAHEPDATIVINGFEAHVDEDTLKEVVEASGDISGNSNADATDLMDGYFKQAKQIITGDQFSDRSLSYIADAVRVVCGLKPRYKPAFAPDDLIRMKRVHGILKPDKERKLYERIQTDDASSFPSSFADDLKAHAAGFLSPLIERIEVGWPSRVLKTGVVLVDLPGIGIARDSYRDVTKRYVREKARAIVVVVDRAGPTEATVDLLRSSGYWDRMVGAADDPLSDPCSMLLVVTKVDDVAGEERRNLEMAPGQTRPSRREVFTQLVIEFKPRMRGQIQDQLGKMGTSDNTSVQAARDQARKSVLDSLEIHPVSAPEFRKLLLDDEDDKAFLQNVGETGIPLLQESLVALAKSERAIRRARIEEVTLRFSQALLNELSIIEGQWRQQSRAADEAERLAIALEEVLGPKQKEYDRRSGSFREFLDETVKAKIEALVQEARGVAEKDVQNYLEGLQGAHWGTLRAAVRRGGCFDGSRHINLPDDISTYFQEPMVAVWGQKLLKDIRKRTSELSSDIAQLVQEICEWANEQGGAQVNAQLLESQRSRVESLTTQMKQVGKEAVDELRENVKNKLTGVIRKPIKSACEQFVKAGDHIGPGVKRRILELFRDLANKSTTAAQKPAIEILQANFADVRKEIHSAFEQWGDPIQETANLIVERHEKRMKRSDSQRRGRILAEVAEVLNQSPIPKDALLARIA
jgi:GTP-binding protein EngB required for normal cell division